MPEQVAQVQAGGRATDDSETEHDIGSEHATQFIRIEQILQQRWPRASAHLSSPLIEPSSQGFKKKNKKNTHTPLHSNNDKLARRAPPASAQASSSGADR